MEGSREIPKLFGIALHWQIAIALLLAHAWPPALPCIGSVGALTLRAGTRVVHPKCENVRIVVLLVPHRSGEVT